MGWGGVEGGQREKERKSQADSALGVELSIGLGSRTLRS